MEKVQIHVDDNTPVWQGLFREWTRSQGLLHAIVEKPNGTVVEVFYRYITFLHEGESECHSELPHPEKKESNIRERPFKTTYFPDDK